MNFKQLILAGTVIASTTLTPLTNVQAERIREFTDVPPNHWSYTAIQVLKSRDIISGYGNGIFGFGDNITRGQVARMIYAYLKPAYDSNTPNPFTDVKGHMFEKEILTITKAGIMNGFGDGKFGPDNVLTREQLASVLTKAFNFKATSTTTFKDVDKNYWATNAISALQENKIAAGTGDNLFEPKNIVTREQYAQFLYNAIVKTIDPEAEKRIADISKALTMDGNDYTYWTGSSIVLKKSISNVAQRLITEVNKKYNENFKYMSIDPTVDIYTPNLERNYEIGAQFTVDGDDENNFDVGIVVNKSTVELAKKWIVMINPQLNLDKEIDNIINNKTTTKQTFTKGNYKITMSLFEQVKSSYCLYIDIQD
ncbi:S-layer protein [Bacillus cereus]|uniref:S-layer homology domain-containing protein n=1 Tax=Bacillus cereus TaxID=1396 RepID=UPI000BEC8057|nr:S-layer homology domain-containing protein [Bacillus cereus]PEC54141.1 S-layer protein [Bacillus cereus]PFE42682.1 S-layer protein [Bacillus cereus]PFN17520.1 S-layer protein [Bacillus cereus]PFS77315.1 S-layer protein [Bacillus cereus]